ncbi:hypothetical protein QYE76_069342 [Lolium multiflorum]|uniref:ACB domain-containing protein n=1 Tax=Lolium multiflorum TaxID=4521 RepID=A0AAD8SI15_LOLMU|nr:hypothetical protein QYE76_069342 [Lolium multiflorum]
MELLFELLLTAAATLLVALLLANLFAAATADHRAAVGPAAAVIAKEEPEEERIIEVDEVMVPMQASPALSEGWVEVEKAPAQAAVAAEGKETAWVAVEEGVPAALAPELFLGAVLEDRKEEGEVGKIMPRDFTLAPAAAAATEAAAKGLGAAPREILGLELEQDRTRQDDSGAGVATIQVPEDAELQKQEVQPTEAVVVEQRHLVPEAAPAQVTDAGMEKEEGAQAAEVIPQELISETVPAEVLDDELEKQQQEEPVTEVDQHELAAEVAPREIPDEVARESASEVAPITHAVDMEEELKEQSVEEVAAQDEQVQNKDEAQCEATPVDQPEKPVPNEELLVPKADDLNVSQQGSSNDKVAVQLPEKEAAALLETPEDEASANMEFEEWEGIERSEVEKRFGAAAAFAASDAGASALSKLDSDVQLQLQGLLKVAVDGPCYDSAQPLTLRPSSRAKWASWQKLGNMHPEIAMGKYMDLLSEVIPRWMGDKTSSTKRHEGDVDSEGAAVTMTGHTSDPQAFRGNEGSTSIDEGQLTSPPNPEKGKSCDIPAE